MLPAIGADAVRRGWARPGHPRTSPICPRPWRSRPPPGGPRAAAASAANSSWTHRPGRAVPRPPGDDRRSGRVHPRRTRSTSCAATRSSAQTWHASRTACWHTAGLMRTAASTLKTATGWPAGAASPSGTASRGSSLPRFPWAYPGCPTLLDLSSCGSYQVGEETVRDVAGAGRGHGGRGGGHARRQRRGLPDQSSTSPSRISWPAHQAGSGGTRSSGSPATT